MTRTDEIRPYAEVFGEATGTEQGPFHFQEQFATRPELPRLVRVPTGAGKTAMAILGWLWRRRYAGEAVRSATPRRLVY